MSSAYEALQKAVVGEPLQYHEGQSIGMLNVLRSLDIPQPGEHEQDATQRAKIVPFSIETAFGYWVPLSLSAKTSRRT